MSTVIVDLSKVDWSLLRIQKTQLIDIVGLEPEAEEMAEGLLHLIDDIQDQAAKQLGEEAIFGISEDDQPNSDDSDYPYLLPGEG